MAILLLKIRKKEKICDNFINLNICILYFSGSSRMRIGHGNIFLESLDNVVHNESKVQIVLLTRTKTSIRYAKENEREKKERKREREKGRRRDIEREGEIRERER